VTALLHDEPPRPEHAAGLAVLIGRLLAKDPESRPTAAEAIELIKLPSGRRPGAEGLASPVTTRTRRNDGERTVAASRPPRRRLWAAVAAIAVLPLVLGVGYVETYGSSARSAGLNDCVQLGGLDLSGSRQWRKHSCSTSLPWTDDYRLSYRYERATSCPASEKTVVLPAGQEQHAVTLCLTLDK
jgi:hypothetical protein